MPSGTMVLSISGVSGVSRCRFAVRSAEHLCDRGDQVMCCTEMRSCSLQEQQML